MFPKHLKKLIKDSNKTGGEHALTAEAGSDRARLWINANVWDGDDRRGATNDRANFNPDELQELIDDLLEHLDQNK